MAKNELGHEILLTASVKSKHGTRLPIGILDTPCYPCRYYAGFLNDLQNPLDNSTHNFFRTQDEALERISCILLGQPS